MLCKSLPNSHTIDNESVAYLEFIDSGSSNRNAAQLPDRIEASKSPEDTVKRGWAHSALPYDFPWDTTMATLGQARTFVQGGTARV
jgi:hypothetical protein